MEDQEKAKDTVYIRIDVPMELHTKLRMGAVKNKRTLAEQCVAILAGATPDFEEVYAAGGEE